MSLINAIVPKWLKQRIVREVRIPVRVPVLQSNLLENRVALITGGSGAIGSAIARRFVDSGCKVIIAGRSQERLEACRRSIGSSNVHDIVLDIIDVASFADKIQELENRGLMPDILVNNAGVVLSGGSYRQGEVSEYDHVLNTNLRGTAFLSRVVADAWRKSAIRGNILNICSTSSNRPGTSPYILSKWGMRALTLGLAKQLIKDGIVVNGLAPGPTDTEAFVASEDNGISCASNPSGRLVTRDEIANLAVILVSDMARMVVGDIVYAGGGAAIVTFDD